MSARNGSSDRARGSRSDFTLTKVTARATGGIVRGDDSLSSVRRTDPLREIVPAATRRSTVQADVQKAAPVGAWSHGPLERDNHHQGNPRAAPRGAHAPGGDPALVAGRLRSRRPRQQPAGAGHPCAGDRQARRRAGRLRRGGPRRRRTTCSSSRPTVRSGSTSATSSRPPTRAPSSTRPSRCGAAAASPAASWPTRPRRCWPPAHSKGPPGASPGRPRASAELARRITDRRRTDVQRQRTASPRSRRRARPWRPTTWSAATATATPRWTPCAASRSRFPRASSPRSWARAAPASPP